MYDLDEQGNIKSESLMEVIRLMAGDRLSEQEMHTLLQNTLSAAEEGGSPKGHIGIEEFKQAVSFSPLTLTSNQTPS